MIHCPRCDIHFSPRNARCPRCGEFETPIREREHYLRENAADRVHDGDDTQRVRDELLDAGFSSEEAHEIVRSAELSRRSETRRHGLLRLGGGVVMVVAGGLALTISGVAFPRYFGGGRVPRSLFWLFGGGLALFLTGLLAACSGTVAMLTGNEPALSPVGERDTFENE